MNASFRAGIGRSRARERLAIALSLALHMALMMPPGFERPGPFGAPAAVALWVTLEPRVDAVKAPVTAEPAVTVSEHVPTMRSAPREVAQDAGTPEAARGHAALGAESSHSERSIEPDAPRSPAVYYTAHELDIYPALRQPLIFNWPSRPEPGGWLTVSLTLNETGVVEDIAMPDASLDRGAEAAVREALRVARFTAAVKDGRAVKSRIVVRIQIGADTRARRR
jgi:protein TonB